MDAIRLAEIADYEDRYGEQSDPARVERLLADASDMLLAEWERFHGAPYVEGASPAFDRSAPAVCCAMVNRTLSVPAAMAGATQFSESLGDYSHSMTYGSPSGDLYLGKTDLKRLGLTGQRRGSVAMGVGGGGWHAPCVL